MEDEHLGDMAVAELAGEVDFGLGLGILEIAADLHEALDPADPWFRTIVTEPPEAPSS